MTINLTEVERKRIRLEEDYSKPPAPKAADPLGMLKALNLHNTGDRDGAKPLPESQLRQRLAQEVEAQKRKGPRTLKKMVEQTWLIIPIAVATLFAIRSVANGLPPERAFPNALGSGIGVWFIPIVMVRVATLVTRQRAVPVLARRVWTFASVLLILVIIREAHN
jgi:hypothetical protein